MNAFEGLKEQTYRKLRYEQRVRVLSDPLDQLEKIEGPVWIGAVPLLGGENPPVPFGESSVARAKSRTYVVRSEKACQTIFELTRALRESSSLA